MAVGAHAEVALSALAGVGYLRAKVSPDPEDQLIASRAAAAARWLADAADHHDDGSCCWDHSAWDTAAVIRALALVLSEQRTRKILAATGWEAKVKERMLAGTRWLLARFRDAENGTVLARLNPAEYAEVGRTVAELAVWDRAATEAVTVEAVGSGIDDVVASICQTLARRRSERMIEVRTEDGSSEIATIWWGDFMGTSEVLRFYAAVNRALLAGSLELPPILGQTIRESVAKCLLLIEHSHFDGLWGAYLDTIALLGAYVEIGESREGLFAEIGREEGLAAQARIVFRVIRWMCDPTQRAADGSVLHTAFLTTFFAQAMVDVASLWRFSSDSIAVVYDEICLLTEAGVSEHRAEQIKALLDRDEARRQLEEAREDVGVERRRNNYERWLRTRFVGSAIVFVVGGLFLVLAGQVTGWVGVTVDTEQTANLLTLCGVVAAVTLSLIGVMWTMGRPPE
ncbi:MAG TPA: hypothetical protein VFI17_02560 [Solirubrobacterales bacterium]|nr:hypothetical protein [Solirubrobacterales bacterium]